MGFEPEIAHALGAKRAARAWAGAEDLIVMAEAAPVAASTVRHNVMELRATNDGEAGLEIRSTLETFGSTSRTRSWTALRMERADGRFGILVSPFFRHGAPLNSEEAILAFDLSEIHMRLGVWWLNHVWRAAELARGAREGLQRWDILVAVACARSLLEGAAYLAVKIPEIVRNWDGLKSNEHPGSDEVSMFLADLKTETYTAHYATKIAALNGSTKKERSVLESRSVQTYIDKLAKQVPATSGIYERLCNAIHPSFGSALRYCAQMEEGVLNSHRIETYYRDPLPHTLMGGNDLRPWIAEAAAEAVTLAADVLMRDLPVLRWLIDDIYLTAELQPPSEAISFPWAITTPERNSLCSCGSGRKSKRCVHRWGLPGTYPVD